MTLWGLVYSVIYLIYATTPGLVVRQGRLCLFVRAISPVCCCLSEASASDCRRRLGRFLRLRRRLIRLRLRLPLLLYYRHMYVSAIGNGDNASCTNYIDYCRNDLNVIDNDNEDEKKIIANR